MGYDVHQCVKGRKMIIGGVVIPYENGLLGHSDADVLIHAIIDSLLGAASMGDIGRWFPDNDPKYKDVSSLVLLKKVKERLEENLYRIGNIDATIIAQRPKMLPYIPKMIENIAQTLEIAESRINIKATTEEGLGFTGTGEGISAQAICLLEEVANYVYDDVYQNATSCSGCKGCHKLVK